MTQKRRAKIRASVIPSERNESRDPHSRTSGFTRRRGAPGGPGKGLAQGRLNADLKKVKSSFGRGWRGALHEREPLDPEGSSPRPPRLRVKHIGERRILFPSLGTAPLILR